MDTRPIPIIPPSSAIENKERCGNGDNTVKYPFISALSMSRGDGENSYASNSLLQRSVIRKTRPVLMKNIQEMFLNLNFPTNIKVADLGCSSGPNTFLVMSEIVNTVNELCQKTGRKSPEFDLCLNDLPENDFNTTFKLIPFFHQNLEKNKELSCSISGVPGSFYSRLFPTKSLHFVHSSYGLHFLSKVPEWLENNKGSVYITSSSPPSVYKAYLYQFQRDFSSFLQLRSEEMISAGRMVLIFIGRNTSNPLYRDCCHFWTILSETLLELAAEGLVSESEVDSFNMPFYDPNEGEIREIIRNEGSFEINKFETHAFDLGESNCKDDYSMTKAGQSEAKCVRAVAEPMLVAHFGDAIIDSLFEKYAERVAKHASCREKTTVTVVLSLTKK